MASNLPHVLLLPGNMCDARLWEGSDRAILKAISTTGLAFSHMDFKDIASIETIAQRAMQQHEGLLIPIGFSMGGIVALQMIYQAPHRIAALALIGATCEHDKRGPERIRQQAEVRAGHLKRIISEELKPNYLAKCHADDPALRALLSEMAMDLGPEIFIAQSEALRTREDLSWTLPDIDVPVLLTCGREDSLCSPKLQDWMGRMTQDAQVTIVNDAGHILPLEQPEVLAMHLANFLSTILKSTRGSPHD